MYPQKCTEPSARPAAKCQPCYAGCHAYKPAQARQFPNHYSNIKSHHPCGQPVEDDSSDSCEECHQCCHCHVLPATPYDCTNKNGPYKIATMRMFTSIMLSSWRRRRDEVQNLIRQLEKLKTSNLKTQEQMDIYNTLFRVEQKRNTELAGRLERSQEGVDQVKSSCAVLSSSVERIESSNAKLASVLEEKTAKYSSLAASMAESREMLRLVGEDKDNLHCNLNTEMRYCRILNRRKEMLVCELCDVGSENRARDKRNRRDLVRMCLAAERATAKLLRLGAKAEAMESKILEMLLHFKRETQLKARIADLRSEVAELQTKLDRSFGARVGAFGRYLKGYQELANDMLHLALWMVLPITPQWRLSLPAERKRRADTTAAPKLQTLTGARGEEGALVAVTKAVKGRKN